MTKLIFGVALVVFLVVAACVGLKSPQLRGVAAGPMSGVGSTGVLASNSRPAVAVQPAEDFRPVAHGVTQALVSRQGAFGSGQSARVWYALHSTSDGKGQLVADLAELHGREWAWSVNPLFNDRRGRPVLRAGTLTHDGVEFTALTYARMADKDPWMPAFKAKALGWDGPLLVRQYTWLTQANRVKLVVEYREPAPDFALPDHLLDDRPALRAFEDRAEAAFRILRQGDANFPEQIEKAKSDEAGLASHALDLVLGEAVPTAGIRLNQ